jgi:subtilase family serine protease
LRATRRIGALSTVEPMEPTLEARTSARWCRRRFRCALVTIIVAASVLVAAGCGGGSSTPAATTAESAAVAFAGCMRLHGLSNFPDPDSSGDLPKPQVVGARRSDPARFDAANNACQRLLANGERGTAAGPATPTGDCDSLTTCYTPRQLQAAYGVLPLLERGIDGRGETVVLPELAEPQFPLPSSDIRQNLAQFDKLFHLPAARVRVVKTLAPAASPWRANGEEVLDTEMVHAIAPRAAIVELLLKGTSLNNIPNAVAASVSALRLGTSLGGLISISAAGQTGGEHCDTPAEVHALHRALRSAADRHETVVAASGDIGDVGEPCHLIEGLVGGTFRPVKEASLPASDPLVLGVGGTTLTASHTTGAYIGESVWGLPFGEPGSHFQASGGGISRIFSRPSYQAQIPSVGARRGVPDVAATASPHTALAVITSTAAGKYTVRGSGGTSAGAPLWAGLIALADQYAGHRLGFVNAALYRIGRSSRYHQAFHDVIAGSNTVRFPPRTINGYHAAAGWDPVTGWGSPNARVLVPLLARYVHPDDGKGL